MHRSSDTAQAYGDSEARIGSLCSDAHFNFVTKIGANFQMSPLSIMSLVAKAELRRLNQSRLYAVMLHRPEVLWVIKVGDVRELQILKERVSHQK